ncbi:hypothetical protein [Burkholderia cenocepacia]|uniref:hypothetical protein n=1 Tax=Burkholderia cenocepacia TaxID=95486 RepID=UPI002230E13D|nr:hypothetical protein [Burkholderia cenocepacia]MCW3609125.1 hypothetical protein [Burkholderia cenocepacia]MCW5189850.1 hypothetical protein [Burkholderia cenocepacia]
MTEITKIYDELSEAELADAQRLFPDVSRDDPYRYVIVTGKMHHRIGAATPIAVRIVDDKGPHFVRPNQVVAIASRMKGGRKGAEVLLSAGAEREPHTLWLAVDPDYLARQIGW